MLTYKRFVSFSISLGFVLVIGAINALFMTPRSEWFANLVMPALNEKIHSFLWLAVYILYAVVTAEFLIDKTLRSYIWSLFLLAVGNPVWCLVFFRLHSIIGALCLSVLLLSDSVFVTVINAKKTKINWLFCLLISVWDHYIAGLNAAILILNLKTLL